MATTSDMPMTEAIENHRHGYKRFVENDSLPSIREDLIRLYRCFDEYNAAFFFGRLIPAHLMLSEPGCPKAYGDHARITGWGSLNQIRLRRSLLSGTHPDVQGGDLYKEGRWLLVEDILLHELVHQYLDEVFGVSERSYHGHGPKFRDECNRIGSILGLPPVRTAKRRGKVKGMPSCAQWPLNVRPKGYYQGAFDFPEVEPETDLEAPAGDEADERQGRRAEVAEDPRARARAALVVAALAYGRAVPRDEREEQAVRLAAHSQDVEHWVGRLVEVAIAVTAVTSDRDAARAGNVSTGDRPGQAEDRAAGGRAAAAVTPTVEQVRADWPSSRSANVSPGLPADMIALASGAVAGSPGFDAVGLRLNEVIATA